MFAQKKLQSFSKQTNHPILKIKDSKQRIKGQEQKFIQTRSTVYGRRHNNKIAKKLIKCFIVSAVCGVACGIETNILTRAMILYAGFNFFNEFIKPVLACRCLSFILSFYSLISTRRSWSLGEVLSFNILLTHALEAATIRS